MSENVTQADREAAAKVSLTLPHAANVVLGNLDDSELVQAFAAHRRAAEIAAGEKVRWACYDGFYEQLLEDYKSNDFLAGVQACLNFIRALDVAQIVGGAE